MQSRKMMHLTHFFALKNNFARNVRLLKRLKEKIFEGISVLEATEVNRQISVFVYKKFEYMGPGKIKHVKRKPSTSAESINLSVLS